VEGDRKLTLFEPGPIVTDDEGAEVRGDPVEHEVWAKKRDRGGRETLSDETEQSEHITVFRIRWLPSLAFIASNWWIHEEIVFAEPVPILIDGQPLMIDGEAVVQSDYRRVWDIEDVEEVPAPRKRWLDIRCEARGELALAQR